MVLDFLGIVGLLGFLIFIIIGIISLFKKNGKAKKQFLFSVISFVIAMIGIINSPTGEETSTDEYKNEVVKKEIKKEIPPSTVADVTSTIKINMSDKDYKDAKEKLNVEFTDNLSIGNGNVGNLLKAKDGIVVVGIDGVKVLSVETFKTIQEAKNYAKELYAKAEKEKLEEAIKQYEKSKIKLSGSGDTSTDMMELKSGYIVVEASHNGGANFIVKLQGEDGQDIEMLVNAIGNYKGKTYAEIPTDGKYYLNVTASGNWKFSITQEPPLEIKDIPNKFSGTGDDVVFFNANKGNYKFNFTHSGSGNFIVRLNGSGLMVNEIGNYSGSMRQVLSTDGYYLLVITADGNWTTNIEK